MSTINAEQVLKILAITDSFNLHRETIFIPLLTEGDGSITILPDGRLRIVCPEAEQFEDWLSELRSHLEKMDLSKVRQS